MTDPRLTVILPAHNAETTIAAAIKSILCQSYPEFELWVLESNSKDRTAEIARSFSDPRLKVFELGSLSFQDCLAWALANAQTEWLARMDADDISFPDRFQKQMDVIRQHPELVLVGTRCVYVTPFGHIFETRPHAASREIGSLNLRLLKEQARFFADASVIFKKSAALQVGGYDPEFRMGDVPMWFRMLRAGKGWEMAEPLYLYRLHPKSISHSQIAASDERYRFLVKYAPQLLHLHFPETISQASAPDPWHVQRYWLRIAAYEVLTGDRQAILQAVSFFDRVGPLQKEAKLIKWFTDLGWIGQRVYRRYRWHKYRHRPDLEQLLISQFGPLTLERQIYSGS